jgi:serine/threonine protein kinase
MSNSDPASLLRIQPGELLTDYSSCQVTVQQIGRGGFGLVFMGPDAMLGGEWLALKTLKPALLAHPHTRELFIREACTWVGLWTHPNILRAQFASHIRNQPFLQLDYAAKGSLRDMFEADRQAGQWNTLPSAVWIAAQIAAGLAELHTPRPAYRRPEPLIHRDLKPENVLLDERGLVRITDFGLAKVLASDPAALAAFAQQDPQATQVAATRTQLAPTQAGAVLGTPAYMAPELWDGARDASPAVDVYAFGILLAELVTSQHPLLALYAPHTHAAWEQAHRSSPPRTLAQLGGQGVPDALEALYQRCLAKRAEERPTAAAVLAALQQVARQLGEEPYSPPELAPHTPHNEVAHWHNWSTVYSVFDLYPEALECNARALALAPDDPVALLMRADLLDYTEQHVASLAAYRRALAARAPDDRMGRKRVLYNMADLLSNDLQQYAEAEACYAEAVALMPGDAHVWGNRAANLGRWARAEAQAGHLEEARALVAQGVEYGEHAVALDPRAPTNQHNLLLLRELLDQLSAGEPPVSPPTAREQGHS